MSDGELARAIADFMKDAPSAEAVSSLGRRLNHYRAFEWSVVVLLHGARCTGGANQLVRLLKNVMVLRLLSRKKADQQEQCAKHQPDQHDFAMSGFVGIVE